MSVRGKNNTAGIIDHEEDLVEKQARLSVQAQQVEACEDNDKKKVEDIPPKKESKKNKTVRNGMSNGVFKHKDQNKEVVLMNDDGISKSNKDEKNESCNNVIKNTESNEANGLGGEVGNEKEEIVITNTHKESIANKTKPVKIVSSTNANGTTTTSEFTNKDKYKKNKVTATKKKLRVVQDQEIPVKKQTSLTDHFQVRRSERRSKTFEDVETKMTLQKQILSGNEDGLEIRVIEEKGRGIFSSRKFTKGDFVCEYAGELIDIQEARTREAEYEKTPEVGSYMYFFEHKSKKYCVDATKESNRLGRLLNHSKVNSNVCTKLFPINDSPYLILVASQDIEPGEELLYDYGDRSKKSVESHPWLKC